MVETRLYEILGPSLPSLSHHRVAPPLSRVTDLFATRLAGVSAEATDVQIKKGMPCPIDTPYWGRVLTHRHS